MKFSICGKGAAARRQRRLVNITGSAYREVAKRLSFRRSSECPELGPPQMVGQGVAGVGDPCKGVSALYARPDCCSEAGALSVPSETETHRHSIEAATQALAALPYIDRAETSSPDYWALPATGGYEHGYGKGLEMGEACLSYLRHSPPEEAGASDGYTHLFLVIRRLAERLQGDANIDPAGETSLTLNGHLAGFCSALEAHLRRPPRPGSDGSHGRGPGQPGLGVSDTKTERPVPRTPGRGKLCR